MRAVALILDTAFGERLDDVAREMPVWIISTPSNDPYIARARRHFGERADITSYLPLRPEDTIETCSQALYDIDEHHGSCSSSHPYDEVLVFGARLADFSADALEELSLFPAKSDGRQLVFRKRGAMQTATG